MNGKDYCINYISLLQENIGRMSSFSSSCKAWAVAVVAAFTAVMMSAMNEPNNAFFPIPLLCVLIIVLLGYLDVRYLALEKAFRFIERDFVALVKDVGEDDEAVKNELYSFPIKHALKKNRCIQSALCSWSVWPYYFGMLVIVSLIACVFIYS